MSILTEIIETHPIHPQDALSHPGFLKEDIEQSISARFEDQVCHFPHHLAVKGRNQCITYQELNAKANRLARALLSQHPVEGAVILLFEQGIDFITALLAILKMGRIYVPLDVSFPHARNAYLLEDSQAKLIVTQTKNLTLAHQLAQDKYIFNLDEVDLSWSAENLEHSVPPETLAYLIYTTGSTGQPKGVVQNHRNVLHNCRIQTHGMQITALDRMTLLYSCSTMGTVRNIFNALLNGATLYPFAVKSNGLTHLIDWLIQEKITVYHSVATLFRHFAHTLTGQEIFDQLRLIVLGGEAPLRQDIELYKKYFPSTCSLYTSLGSTETGTVRQFIITHQTPLESQSVPLGYAVEDKEIFLIDEEGKPVREGEVGEIIVKSQYLALGYWQKPVLTKTVFSVDHSTGQLIYRMGDMGRFLPDGCLIHMGRKDFQVKIRGYRVEINEIEALLISLENIQEAIVTAYEDAQGEKHLAAYLIPQHFPAPTIKSLQDALMNQLPDYMLPSCFIFLETFPLTPNGKIDRRALPKPERVESHKENLIAPRNEIEHQLQILWEKVMQIHPIGVTQNFFELGGHSLLAVRLLAEIKKHLKKDLPVLILFQAPTIEQLAKMIDLSEEEGNRLRKTLLSIQPEGTLPPVFFVGSTNLGRLLSTQLGNHQPMYGLNIFGLRTMHELESSLTVQKIAKEFIKEVQNVQPHGPYHFCSYCGDARIAFEMAQQLFVQGEHVALLAFIDVLWQAKKRYHCLWRNLVKFGFVSYLVYLGSRKLHFKLFRLKLKFNQWKGKWYRSSRNNVFPLEIQQTEFVRTFLGALRNYSPQPYSGKITLFLSAEWYTEELTEFSELAQGGIEVYEIPGFHDNLFVSPQLEVLGKKIKSCLDKELRQV